VRWIGGFSGPRSTDNGNMERYVCIHGHFYQPPRENPWLEVIEQQDEARPYHDWNEKITAECYAANCASRILDQEGRIERIVNNYSKMSFNFGPTLLAWLEIQSPEVYEAILEADRLSQEKFSGHGSALAQAYNHMILPLASQRDKFTQVEWGIRDFQRRFGRDPEGMWLPETAVDLESLEILAECGIHFTILAPKQALRVRQATGGDWLDVSDERIDSTMAYTVRLPSGRNIAIFFYHGPLSRAVAFETVLRDGESFAKRLLDIFSTENDRSQLSHIATDGETYGHHHRFGDMALAFALNYLESKDLARLTNYGEFLAKHPPTHEVEISENSSWSCSHGVERWRSDCGCHTGVHPDWNQKWRAPVREALDWLRDRTASSFEDQAKDLLHDPWSARNHYIGVILERSPDSIHRFLQEQGCRPLTEEETVTVFKLMELERHSMLMYTSCGWFFDDLAGIETVQIMTYGARVMQLAQELFGKELEREFLEILGKGKSNRLQMGDGREIYESLVRPSTFNLARVAAHYAVVSLFNDYPEQTKVYCYTAESLDKQFYEAGRAKLTLGKARITSDLTLESAIHGFAVLHLGDHNLSGGVREFPQDNSYEQVAKELSKAFNSGDFAKTIRVLDKNFGGSTFDLKSLFADEQRRILKLLLRSTLEEIEEDYRQLYEHHTPLLRFLKEVGTPPPRALHTAAEFILNGELQRTFQNDDLELNRIEHLLEEAQLLGISLDGGSLEYSIRKALERLAKKLKANPNDLSLLQKLEQATALVSRLSLGTNLWEVQNICFGMADAVYPEYHVRAEQGDGQAGEWLEVFRNLAKSLSVRV
jgi:alpha-amylase/alpha-mannosidase (GH57 family)